MQLFHTTDAYTTDATFFIPQMLIYHRQVIFIPQLYFSVCQGLEKENWKEKKKLFKYC